MEKVDIKKELENLNETLAEGVNKMNIDVYGKKFVDLANQYIKDTKKYIESIIDTSIVLDDISEDKKETFMPSLMSDINNFVLTEASKSSNECVVENVVELISSIILRSSKL